MHTPHLKLDRYSGPYAEHRAGEPAKSRGLRIIGNTNTNSIRVRQWTAVWGIATVNTPSVITDDRDNQQPRTHLDCWLPYAQHRGAHSTSTLLIVASQAQSIQRKHHLIHISPVHGRRVRFKPVGYLTPGQGQRKSASHSSEEPSTPADVAERVEQIGR